MNVDEVLAGLSWNDDGTYGTCYIEKHVLGANLEVILDEVPVDENGKPSDSAILCLQALLAMDKSITAEISKLLYDRFLTIVSDSGYMMVELREGETEREANIRHFGVKTADDVLKRVSSVKAYIYDDPTSFVVEFDHAWNDHASYMRVSGQDVEFD